MSKEEIIEIFNNLKEYIQNKIDSGEHKIYYNDLGWDVKCIDCINAIDNILELYNNQKEEIEEFKEKTKLKQYIFKIRYVRQSYDGWYDINSTHNISLVAETIEEALKKLEDIDKYKYKKILGWHAEELLEE